MRLPFKLPRLPKLRPANSRLHNLSQTLQPFSSSSRFSTPNPHRDQSQHSSPSPSHSSQPHARYSRAETEDVVPHLAKKPMHPLSLADLVKHGRPPLSAEALLASARFTLSLLPIRLAHRIQALRNLPYIVVSNPNIRRIYDNYTHSLSTLLPWQGRTIRELDDEIRFTEVLAELVQTHTDTIPILARGFLECRKYISPGEVTRFLDEHLRARIGTRLIAEQHIALHYSSAPHAKRVSSPDSSDSSSTADDPSSTSAPPITGTGSYIGVIDTALRPATIIDSCGGFVADICELNYGVRPRWLIDGEPDTTFAFVPMHLEYIVTELLKNAFRATVENGMNREPVVITIAPEQAVEPVVAPLPGSGGVEERGREKQGYITPLDDNAPGVTIRIRDRGGGIAPEVLPHIWSYSYTTFNNGDGDDEDSLYTPLPGTFSATGYSSTSGGGGGDSALRVISAASSGASTIAGLGYGLPLSRAYAEYFGGGIAVQSLYGWGTDVYLKLKGVGRID